jgi:alkylation response protein AidB-like acyl-CoA dehydrogenase
LLLSEIGEVTKMTNAARWLETKSVPTNGATPDQLAAAIRRLGPQFKGRALATEENCTVPAENVDALRDLGFFKLVQPRAFAGHECDFDLLVDLNIAIAKSCASTAWVCGLLAAHQWLVAGFPAEAQHDVWDDNPDALVCGSYAPAAKAAAVAGGYQLTGRWSFASGCDNSDWALCAALLPPPAEGGPLKPAFLLVPAKDYTIDDTWHVIGLAGTGSKTLVLDGVFVPEHRILTFEQATSGNTPGARVHADNPAFSIPLLCNLPSCLASVAVGAALGALDDYLTTTSRRITRGAVAGASNRMAEFATVQLRVAEAAACGDAAREVLLRDLRARAQSVRAGREIGIQDRITSRRGQAFAVSLAIRATEALNASTGGLGLDLSNPVQRAWRDANAVGRHISMNWDVVGTMYGQLALGLDPVGQY